jgi:hypothetical protein
VEKTRRTGDVSAPRQDKVKTSLCHLFARGHCYRGGSCWFAHGEAELKKTNQKTWQPVLGSVKTTTSEITKLYSIGSMHNDEQMSTAPAAIALGFPVGLQKPVPTNVLVA